MFDNAHETSCFIAFDQIFPRFSNLGKWHFPHFRPKISTCFAPVKQIEKVAILLLFLLVLFMAAALPRIAVISLLFTLSACCPYNHSGMLACWHVSLLACSPVGR
jgi:hypothetical protein